MSDLKPSSEIQEIDHAAAEWLIRRDAGLSAAEQDEFFSWLAADPRHGERFAQHQRTWKEFNLLAQWRPEHSAEPNPDLLAKPRARSRWGKIIAWTTPLAVAAALALGWFGLSPLSGPVADVQPAIAAVNSGTRVLEDGSTVELRDDSEIRVAFTAGERRVTLVRGEAFFSVAKNAARPFIVRANGVDVRAVGTSFNVRLDLQRVEVLVTEGKVRVTPPAAMAADIPLLEAGHCAVVPLDGTAATPQIATFDQKQISRALAWQPRVLDFQSTPLSEVVMEFNRRNRTQLVLADPALEAMPIVALIRSDNVEGFVRLLETTKRVRAERSGDTITLVAAR